jgi:hypothetical protein
VTKDLSAKDYNVSIREGRQGDLSMARRHGNFNFIKPEAKPPAFSVSSFERAVALLKLSPEQYARSPELREWVFRNKEHKYVPPELLLAFGFQVNT